MPSLLGGAARHPDFRRLWAAQSISLLGTGLGALPFAALLFLDASGTDMALLAACTIAPGLLVGLPAGAWVDRLRRRPLLIAADLGRAGALASLLIAAALGHLRIEHLFAVALVNGALEIVFDAAYLAHVPSLVPPGDLVDANSRLAASASVAEATSFGIGGWVAQLAGSLWAIALDAFSYLTSALFVWRMQAVEPGPAPEPGGSPNILREVAEGGRTIAHDSRLAAIGGASIALGLGHGFIGAVILVFANRDLGLGTGWLGLIFGIGGLTSLLGALAAGPLAARLGTGRAMVLAAAISGASSLTLVAAGGPAWAAALVLIAGQLLGDPFSTIREVNEVTIRQSVAPPHMLGRVNSGFRFAQLVAMLAGSLIAAALVPLTGLRAMLATGAACNLAVPVILALSRDFRSPVRIGTAAATGLTSPEGADARA